MAASAPRAGRGFPRRKTRTTGPQTKRAEAGKRGGARRASARNCGASARKLRGDSIERVCRSVYVSEGTRVNRCRWSFRFTRGSLRPGEAISVLASGDEALDRPLREVYGRDLPAGVAGDVGDLSVGTNEDLRGRAGNAEG